MAARPDRPRVPEAGQVLTVDQVAAYLQLNRLTVYRYIREGKIPAAKIGKLYRVLKADVDRFLEAQKTTEQAARRRPSKPSKAGASVVPQRSPEDVYVGPSWSERLRDREHREKSAPDYPLEWVMRGLH
ncbi:MAG: helix-turn-helix domain-containing protein [Armatimonadota bacterium]|nr:helix-turn-helix domain-containing protein [Armatimonadota bacterium]